MIGLFDRDVFLKLCCCGLFDEALAALGVTQPFRLVSTTSTSSNNRILKRTLPGLDLAPVLSHLAHAIATVPVNCWTVLTHRKLSGGFQISRTLTMANTFLPPYC